MFFFAGLALATLIAGVAALLYKPSPHEKIPAATIIGETLRDKTQKNILVGVLISMSIYAAYLAVGPKLI